MQPRALLADLSPSAIILSRVTLLPDLADNLPRRGMVRLTTTGAATLVGFLLALSLPSFWAQDLSSAMTGLLPQIDLDEAYFPWVSPVLLYVAAPLVVLSSLALVMAPGLVAALILGRPRSFWEWLLDAFGLSLLLVSVPVAVMQAIAGRSIVGASFVTVTMMMTAALGLWLYGRAAADAGRAPLIARPSGFAVATVIGVPLLFMIATLPKFFWETFNGDGGHMFAATRLLLFKTLPFFEPGIGPIGGWPGINGLAVPFPPSWFMRLFGESEVAIRLPLLLCLPLLAAAIITVAEAGTQTRLRPSETSLVWLSTIAYALTMCYSATYDPYSSEVSMPAPQDTLVMIAFLAAVAGHLRGSRVRLVLWSSLALLLSPAVVPLAGASLCAFFVIARGPARRQAMRYGLGLICLLAAQTVAPSVLAALGAATGGSEHSGLRLLMRQFGYVALLDVQRFAWVAIPCGLYPLAVLLAWRRADVETRALLVASAMLFAFFYSMGTVSLHYFVPVMLLPVAAFWRSFGGRLRPGALAACYAAAIVAVFFTMPSNTAVADGARRIGERIEIVGFDTYARGDNTLYGAAEALSQVLPTDAHHRVPDSGYGGSPVAWVYYSHRADPSIRKHYSLRARSSPAPASGRAMGRTQISVVYVYSEAALADDLAMQPRGSYGRSILTVPRHVLFFRGDGSDRPGLLKPAEWPWLRKWVDKLPVRE